MRSSSKLPARRRRSSHRVRALMRAACLLVILAVVTAGAAEAYDTEHVVLVIIDGLRYTEGLGDPSHTFVPKMAALSQAGAIIEPFQNDGATYTRAAVPAIWCGAWTSTTGFSDATCGGQWNYHSDMPSVFEYYRKQLNRPQDDCIYVLKNLCSWKGSFDPGYGPDYWPQYHTVGYSDLDVWAQAQSILTTVKPSFMLLYLADVDHGGHSGDWTTYTQAISTADDIVDQLWSHLQADPHYAGKTTMLVTNDHGRHTTDFTGHGDGCVGCRTIQLLAIGPDIEPGLVSTTPRTIPDIVPTIGELLGFVPEQSTGSVMDEIFLDVTGIEEPPVLPGLALKVLENPSRGRAEITFRLPDEGPVHATVYDVRGREVAVLHRGLLGAGPQRLQWNGTGNGGDPARAGVYFIHLRTETAAATHRVVFLR